MPTFVLCPTCGSNLQIPDASIGKTVKCPKCFAKMMIPQSSFPDDLPPAPVPASAAPPQRNPFSTVSSSSSKVLRVAAERDAEEEQPSRRRPSRKSRRDDDDDFDYRRRSSNYGFQCPYCGSKNLPMKNSKISTGGWVVFAMMILFCFPLFFIGLLMKEDYRECADCGIKIGG